ncbi:MAG: metal ABC transporter permease [Anaerolineae bacterium]|nr:metal ABC transporter permease [Anaerolineae bacterium]
MYLDDTLTIITICSLVAISGALLGTFLILRRLSLMSDAISHSIVFGIVVGFIIFHTTDSLVMIIAAGLTGLLTVWLTEVILRTGLVKEDASIGLVFPALFSIGVILISKLIGNIHIDTDTALVGEVALAPFDTIALGNLEIARSLVTMIVMTVINLLFVVVFYKELKLTTFDAGLAASLGFAPALLHYALMGLVSVTAVTSFDAVGAVLLVAFMVVPASAAYLLTDRLNRLILIAAIIGVLACMGGTQLAIIWNASISGCIVLCLGIEFGLTLVFAPERGLLAGMLRRRRQKWEFAAQLLVVHLLNHEDTPEVQVETAIRNLPEHLNWQQAFADQVIQRANRRGWVQRIGDYLSLTDQGRTIARGVMAR